MSYDKYAGLSAVEVCEQIGQTYKRLQDYCITACYNMAMHKHGDRKPSLTVYGFDKGYYCYACGESGTNSWLLKQYGVREDNYMPKNIERKTTELQQPKIVSTDAYCARLQALWEKLPLLPKEARDILEAKGFDAEAFEYMPNLDPLAGWRWHTNQIRGWSEGIFIPYVQNGKMVTARLRRIANDDGPRFLSMPGNTMFPYYIDMAMTNKRVMVTEGETDCLTLNFLGLPAVGIPGATSGTAIARLIEQALCYGTELVVIPDNDEAGEKFAHRMLMEGYENKVAVSRAKVPFGKDVNEWFLNATNEQLNAFLERYEVRQPMKMSDSLDVVRSVFGDVEVLTHEGIAA